MTVYALLVGINKYAAVRHLNGCVQDVERMKEFLRARVKPEDLAKPMTLLDEQATRQAIIDGFESYLSQAQDGDVALFYYSGHGSQENAPTAFWEVEPNKLNQTLVCHDSRIPNQADAWDLADKELAYLVEKISAGKPNLHALVILDSCHSGSATRDDDDAGVRMTPADNRVRPIESYLIKQPPASAQVGDNWYNPPQGKHILMAACRSEEVARERALGEKQEMQGVFSFYLREALKSSGPDLTYRDLFKHASAMVRLMISSQTPQLETRDENINQKFLGGEVLKPRTTTYSVFLKGEDWMIDGGTIHGIGKPVNEGDRIETTKLAIFPKDDTQLDLKKALGTTTVLDVTSTESKIGSPLTTNDGKSFTLAKGTYKAVVIASPLPRSLVRLSGDEAALPAVRDALKTANDGKPSIFVRVAESEADQEQAQLSLIALADEQVYRIRRTHDSLALFVDTPYSDPQAAALAVQRLEHIARWIKICELHNPDTNIKSDDITLTVTSVDIDGHETEVDPINVVNLCYKNIDGKLEKPGLKIKITNNTTKAMYAALVNVAPSYKVWPVALPGTLSTVKLDPQTSVLVADGKRITLSIPDALPSSVTEINDLFKLIVSTNDFDATILEEKPLPIQFRADGKNLRSANLVDSLTSMLGRIPFRDGGFDDVDTLSDWRTIDLNITTTRPQSEVPITAATKTVSLGEGVTLINDAGLNATARLMTDPESGREVGNLGVPPWLREDPPVYAEPFALVPTRSGEPGLSVLDFSSVDNYQSVTPETPLKLHVPVSLKQNEHVLPYGFDGEFYLPLGRVTDRTAGTEISLEQLPDPEGKSLTNSLRIYFHKVISGALGVEFSYPRLAVVTYNKTKNQVEYETDLDTVKAAVAQATNILLYIHGIIGETASMTPSAWTEVDGWKLTDHYDLVLAFDYENLNTGIAETGQLLKDKLTAVGLGPGHQKKLHIFAHSMGGLVSRWMIEHLDGGAGMVKHLFMFGTPNGGSPLPKIQDLAFTGLTLGLNGLTIATGWPLNLLGTLLNWWEKADKMLDEMAAGSTILNGLRDSRDPKCPYTIVAGNTALIEAAKVKTGNEPSRLERLIQRMNKYRLMDLAFLKQPNDIAVAVTSIQTVSADRNPSPNKLPPAVCDHMSYFIIEGGLATLIAAVRDVLKEEAKSAHL